MLNVIQGEAQGLLELLGEPHQSPPAVCGGAFVPECLPIHSTITSLAFYIEVNKHKNHGENCAVHQYACTALTQGMRSPLWSLSHSRFRLLKHIAHRFKFNKLNQQPGEGMALLAVELSHLFSILWRGPHSSQAELVTCLSLGGLLIILRWGNIMNSLGFWCVFFVCLFFTSIFLFLESE